MTIVNYNSSVVSKFEASLTDDTKVVIYDRHMFIVQATCLMIEDRTLLHSKGTYFLSLPLH
jgi:hypothetical protein